MTINVQDPRMARVVDPGAARQVIAETFEFTEGPVWHPNGLCLSLDESELFVADTSNGHVRRFRLTDGGLDGGDVFCDSPKPDGLKVDSAGNLYAGGPGGVHVYDGTDGVFLGVIETPEFCANFTWGDDDFRTMYLTASKGLYRVRVNIPGRPLF